MGGWFSFTAIKMLFRKAIYSSKSLETNDVFRGYCDLFLPYSSEAFIAIRWYVVDDCRGSP